MTDKWFVKILGEELGPMPFSNLVDLVKKGSLSADDSVRQGNKERWVPARTISELFPDSSGISDSNRSFQSVDRIHTTSQPESRSPSSRSGSSSADLDIPDGWYCRVLGLELGPMPLDDLRKMALQGELSSDDEVRSGKDSDWVTAKTVSQLFPRDASSKSIPTPQIKKSTSKAGPSTAVQPRTNPVSNSPAVTTEKVQDPVERVTATKKPVPPFRHPATLRRDAWHEPFIEKLKDHPKFFSGAGISILIVSFLYFMLFTGGSPDASNSEPEEIHPMTDAYPIMLDGKNLREGNINWKLRHRGISDVEVHEISDKTSDGSYTATISFTSKSGNRGIKAKVEITYKIQTMQARKGFSISSYPVSNLKPLSVNKIGN